MSEAEVLTKIVEALASKTEAGSIVWERYNNRDTSLSYREPGTGAFFMLSDNLGKKVRLTVHRDNGKYIQSTEEPQKLLFSMYQLVLSRYAQQYEAELNRVLESLDE